MFDIAVELLLQVVEQVIFFPLNLTPPEQSRTMGLPH
jgi:hypothetical protein